MAARAWYPAKLDATISPIAAIIPTFLIPIVTLLGGLFPWLKHSRLASIPGKLQNGNGAS